MVVIGIHDKIVKYNNTKLVAKGFTQSYRIDYTKTFALVTKLNIVGVFFFRLDSPTIGQ